MRVLVAGATGYLGGFVARELLARGHHVRALARTPGKLDPSLDDVFTAEVTRPATLAGCCDGVDAVFSSVGITRQKDGLTFRDVDYRGNKNLLDVALRTGVSKFVYVSVFDGPRLRHLDIVAAHEDFVDELRTSGLDYAVLRPTGYFSDLGEFFEMARKGRVFLVGSGENRANPIHGADLAARCAEALQGDEREIDVGGPEVLTWNEVAALAFAALSKSAKVTRVPGWMMGSAVRFVRLFNRHQAGLLAFFHAMATTDAVAPAFGSRTLAEHFRELAQRSPD
jgi:uncharacterized protein YbjT (DUF2867 family)